MLLPSERRLLACINTQKGCGECRHQEAVDRRNVSARDPSPLTEGTFMDEYMTGDAFPDRDCCADT